MKNGHTTVPVPPKDEGEVRVEHHIILSRHKKVEEGDVLHVHAHVDGFPIRVMQGDTVLFEYVSSEDPRLEGIRILHLHVHFEG